MCVYPTFVSEMG